MDNHIGSYSEWLNEMDEPFQKARVNREIWANMKTKTSRLLSGACHKCQRNTETLFPVLIDVCRACMTTLLNNGALLTKTKRFLRQSAICSWCDRKLTPVPPIPAKVYVMNPYYCETCLRHFDPSGRRQHTI